MIIIRCILAVKDTEGDEAVNELKETERAAEGEAGGPNGREGTGLLPEAAQEAARLIRDRRSVRRYTKRVLDGRELADMLELAARTTALEHDGEALRFIIFATDEGKRTAGAAIMAAYSGQGLYRWVPGKLVQAMAERVAKIPAIVAVARRTYADEAHNDALLAAASAIVHSFTLLAWERRLGLVWNTEPVVEHEALTSGIGLAADEALICLLYIGEYDKPPKGRRRKPAADKWTVLDGRTGKEERS